MDIVLKQLICDGFQDNYIHGEVSSSHNLDRKTLCWKGLIFTMTIHDMLNEIFGFGVSKELR